MTYSAQQEHIAVATADNHLMPDWEVCGGLPRLRPLCFLFCVVIMQSENSDVATEVNAEAS